MAKRKRQLDHVLANELRNLWLLSGPNTFTDQEIADRCGITFGQLRGWLQRNRKFDYPVVEDEEEPRTGRLRDVRTRARAGTKAGYLVRLHKQMKSAEDAADYKTASKILCWLMEKQFPLDFGNKAKEPETEQQKVIRMPLTKRLREEVAQK